MEKLTRALNDANPNKQGPLHAWAQRDREQRDKRITPAGLRWMVFVDGENLAIRFKGKACQVFGQTAVTNLSEENFIEDVFVWPRNLARQPSALADHLYKDFIVSPEPVALNYYTSITGDRQRVEMIEDALWRQKLRPIVFHKQKKDAKAKGVDITLTRDLLTQAFLDNYDLAVLFSGDADFVPVIEEVRRLGKSVILFAFNDWVKRELRNACNACFDVWKLFEKHCAEAPRAEGQDEEHTDSRPAKRAVWTPVASSRTKKLEPENEG
ncbi:MAG: NYN domain-containing protein [Candidatus Eremiobacteraeota bacterium]|nr:NYN domain-containing protein [Candidatus Eremiobacteraeota bacterium]